jgi:ATP-dependent DNA helicase RecQ
MSEAAVLVEPDDPTSLPDSERLLALLQEVFGYPSLRPGQADVIGAVMNGENVLAVMPTGAGKSMCFQLPALARGGLCVVVSPLIALMRDQVSALRAVGIEAGSLNSSTAPEEADRIFDALEAGTLRLLYLSPERLASGNARFLDDAKVDLLAIDEAHCVSQWGHDFRPEYAQLGDVRRRLGDVQTIALTATADAATRDDIAGRLFDATPNIFVHGFDRPNLKLAMQPKNGPRRQIADFVAGYPGESGIVYCNSRKQTEQLAKDLSAKGVTALAYHAGMHTEDREDAQDRFLKEDGVVVCATVAFGMGIDKPDVRYVAHAGLPKSIEAYYQEIGRAGRDGLPADTLTLYGMDDIRLRRLQIDDGDATDAQKAIERQRLNALVSLAEAPKCRRQTLLAYFGEEAAPCGNCDLCAGGIELFDGTVDAQKALSAILRTGQRFGMEHLINVLRGDVTDRVTKFGHEDLPTFGVGKDRSPQQWRAIFRQLYALGIATVELGEYGAWIVGPNGRAALKGESKVMLRLDRLNTAGRKPRRERAAAAPLPDSVDESLLSALKARRRELATELSVPAYVVFPDRTLIEIAAGRPKSLGAMGGIHGVGAKKLEKFGQAFLDVVMGDES